MRRIERPALAAVVLSSVLTACGGSYVQAGARGQMERFCSLLRQVEASEDGVGDEELNELARLVPDAARPKLVAMTRSGIDAPGLERLSRDHCEAWTAIPATPAGHQLRWALRQLNGNAELRTQEVSTRFTAEFLRFVAPPEQVVELLRQAAIERGPFKLVGYAQPVTRTTVVGVLRSKGGQRAAIRIAVESRGAHRIVAFELGDAPATVVTVGRHSGYFDVGGRRLFLRCRGQGSPTVVLDGGTVADWFVIQNRLARLTQVCAYDRPNVPWSRSDPAPTPRTAQDTVGDLRRALAVAGVAGPYVLAAPSNSGLSAQLFANLYSGEVRGLVLIDAVHPEYRARRLELLRRFSPGMAPPPRLNPPAIDPEQFDVETSSAQVLAAQAVARPLQLPVYVLTHGRPDPVQLPAGSPERADEMLWRQLQDELAALVPGAWHLIVADTGHDIPGERPEVVIDAVARVLEAARTS